MSANGENGGGYEVEERVSSAPHPDQPNNFIAQIHTTKKSGVTGTRPFETTDMNRVLDFEDAGRIVAVGRDETVMIGDYEGDGTGQISFPIHHVVLRGGFIFCYDPDDVDNGNGGRYTTYEAPPARVIPLDHVDVQFPPGGRRVFREHAQTAAQTGYELIIQHVPTEGSSEGGMRPPAFLVADSLGKRNKWKEAVMARTRLNKPTLLRAGYTSAAAAAAAASEDPMSQQNKADRNAKMEESSRKDKMLSMVNEPAASKSNVAFGGRSHARNREAKSMEKKILEVSEDADLAAAVLEFGTTEFSDKEWMNNFWLSHSEVQGADTCYQMEKWLQSMKKSLKGAVLEQYEYFVQASGEMTTMGREVASLKSRIETQVDTLKEMREIDFLGALQEDEQSNNDEIMGRDDDESEMVSQAQQNENEAIFGDDLRAIMDRHRRTDGGDAEQGLPKNDDASSVEAAPPIEVPDWLDEIDEEIMAIVRECRFNSAIELYHKGVNEIADLLDKHEQPTAYRLTRKQLDRLSATKKTLKVVGNRISNRLEQSLRRKNEALRQANKRERGDATASLAPLVSPCALNDDALYLQLLVKLGRTQEAADAYSSRRSLLLLETLQERPMSGAGTVDLVIYAAQLSQSFFSCLASSVEGFLDLFLTSQVPTIVMNGSGGGGHNSSSIPTVDKSEDSDASSLHSHSLGAATTKNLPAGAVSALVLWCDSELSKFAIAFGGTRILSNLALSPPKSNDAPRGPRVVNNNANTNDTQRDRKNAIEVAAQCIDQAFLYASANLDSVGLPLTPRLAEMVRVRLKRCEREVSLLLDERWHTLTQDWRKQQHESGNSIGPGRYS